jgi:murein DD-endopeptidase MepM/ murein hydrolase activator NlpD
VKAVENPVHPLQGSLADEIWGLAGAPLTLVNPRVLLVTAGVALDWQIPPDRPLPKAIAEIGGQLREHYLAFRFNPRVRAQHPEVVNAASYALYAFFGYDREKVRLWEQTYQALFGAPRLSVAAAMPTPNATPRPFMARPFAQPPVPTPFYTLNSFLDHDAPYTYNEGTLTRFDGRVLQGDRNECDLGKSCYSGHEGLDYDTGREYPAIKPPVYAVADGVVSRVREECGQVEILHEARQVASVYMHMEDIQVTQGQTVAQGALLGYTSNVAINEPGECSSSGAHLHFHVRFQHDQEAFIEPFGWWGTSSDPLETYMADGWSGSWWLWQGDEAGDGSLVVDDRESQAQLFHPVYDRESGQTWWYDPSGYNGGAWWTYSVTDESMSTNWGIWGVEIPQPGVYCISAYWPQHPDNTDTARYQIFSQAQGLLDTVVVSQRAQGGTWVPLGEYTFSPGPAVVILTDFAGAGGEASRRVYFDAVKWEAGPCGVTRVQVQIASGPEDAGPEPSACAYATSWNEIYFGECANGSLITSGFRFGNVPVPQNAQIVEAYMEFTVDGPYDVPLQVRIYGEASGDAQPFSDTDRPENRPRTQASVLWTIPATDHWELGMIRRTPDLTALVREIVSRPDWQAYHGMGFIFETVSSASGQHRRVIGYERPVWYPGSEHAARLVIRYAGAIPPTPTPTPTPTPGPCVLQAMQAQIPGLQDLELFYRGRNKLTQTPAGQRYMELYYRYSPALIRLLQEDEEVRRAFGEALQLWQPALRAWVQGKEARLHRGQIVALQRFLRLLAERGEPSLRAAVAQEMGRIPWSRLAGMRVSEVEALLLGTAEAPQGMPVPTGTPRP